MIDNNFTVVETLPRISLTKIM